MSYGCTVGMSGTLHAKIPLSNRTSSKLLPLASFKYEFPLHAPLLSHASHRQARRQDACPQLSSRIRTGQTCLQFSPPESLETSSRAEGIRMTALFRCSLPQCIRRLNSNSNSQPPLSGHPQTRPDLNCARRHEPLSVLSFVTER